MKTYTTPGDATARDMELRTGLPLASAKCDPSPKGIPGRAPIAGDCHARRCRIFPLAN